MLRSTTRDRACLLNCRRHARIPQHFTLWNVDGIDVSILS